MATHGAWAFPPQLDQRGRVQALSLEDSVRQSIRLILATARGERIMRPDFGSELHRYAFEIVNTATLDLVKDSVLEAVLDGEPRIEDLTVSVSTSELAAGRLIVKLGYRIRGMTAKEELLHPFPVEG